MDNIILTKDKILEAKDIIIKGKEKCFNPDTDFSWALEVLRTAFKNGYDIVKVC